MADEIELSVMDGSEKSTAESPAQVKQNNNALFFKVNYYIITLKTNDSLLLV